MIAQCYTETDAHGELRSITTIGAPTPTSAESKALVRQIIHAVKPNCCYCERTLDADEGVVVDHAAGLCLACGRCFVEAIAKQNPTFSKRKAAAGIYMAVTDGAEEEAA